VAPFLELGIGFQGDLTVKDNIFLYGALLGMSKHEVLGKYDWIIDFAGLERFVDAKLKNLSSGMQVRLGFSITVSIETPILLVDEVLAVGDIDFQQKCYDCFESFKKNGRTILFVSHDLNAVEKFCDRVVLLENGEIKAQGECGKIRGSSGTKQVFYMWKHCVLSNRKRLQFERSGVSYMWREKEKQRLGKGNRENLFR
jgi:lipopolysaccharide transport system ATP-binding protein